MSSQPVTVEAPAKVNLHLAVGALRADGYHDVTTVLQAVDLTDRLVIRRGDAFSLRCEPDLGVPAERNLVTRAVLGLAERLGIAPSVEIDLTKRIPAGAGLGGGSSDAAAAIAGAAALWGVQPDDPILTETAANVGADVPFFLRGGCALFGGRGDEFMHTVDAPVLDLVIVKPSAGVATAQAYAHFDRAPEPPGAVDELLAACASGDVYAIAASLSNNMEAAAVALVPDVADALAWVRSAQGVLGGVVSGSGSSVFGICADRGSAESAAEAACASGLWATAVRSSRHGIRVRPLEEAS